MAPGFTLREALDLINDDADIGGSYIVSPEPDILTDKDSGHEDEGRIADNVSDKLTEDASTE